MQDRICFTCRMCGKCCEVEEGVVYLTSYDIKRISKALGMPVDAFKEKYTTRDPDYLNKPCLIDTPEGDCPFFKDNACTIYKSRPLQCRSFPFWPEIIRSDAGIRKVMKTCPGFGSGKAYTSEEIEEIVMKMVKAGL